MNAELCARSDLRTSCVNEMFMLFCRHFSGVTRSQFIQDLDAKSWVILLTEGAQLRGFTTLDFQITHFRGKKESVVYSGDTIMDPQAWNSSILSRAWIEAVYDLHRRLGQGPLWWLLITSGFRTYRMLPVFWREFFPCCNVSTPDDIQQRLNTYARERFASCFDSETGIVRFPDPQSLLPHLGGIPNGRLRNRHVTFFDQHNPGHTRGDELVCITRIDDTNLSAAGHRVVASIRRQPVLSRSQT